MNTRMILLRAPGKDLRPEAEGVSRHEATLRAIREMAARRGHEAKVADLSAQARERYAEVLNRLGR